MGVLLALATATTNTKHGCPHRVVSIKNPTLKTSGIARQAAKNSHSEQKTAQTRSIQLLKTIEQLLNSY
jgi:hypothetical protein